MIEKQEGTLTPGSGLTRRQFLVRLAIAIPSVALLGAAIGGCRNDEDDEWGEWGDRGDWDRDRRERGEGREGGERGEGGERR